jgi:hypothetical protein
MAITDRNLTAGTTLWARYKGQVHTAEVVETDGGRAFRLSDGQEFTSPSAAGTAITGKSCNGWAFWSVGEPVEKPVTAEPTSKAKRAGNTVPKPEKPKRARRERTIPRDGNGHALPIVEQVDGTFSSAATAAPASRPARRP